MSQEIFSSTGATGTIHGTQNGVNSNITQLIALEPAGVATPTPTPTPSPTATPTPGPGRITLRAAATGNNGVGSTSLTIGLPAAKLGRAHVITPVPQRSRS